MQGFPVEAIKDARSASSIAVDPHSSARELLNWLRFQVEAGHDEVPIVVDDDGVEYKIVHMKKTVSGHFQIEVTEA